jgi:GTP cyclohydrolase I
LVGNELDEFFKSLDGKTDEEKKKAIEEYIKTNAEKAQESKRELYSLISYHYGYTLDQIRAMNYPDIVVLRDGLHHRLCEHHGVPYESKKDEKEKNADIVTDGKTKFDAGNINDIKAFWGV